LLTVVRVRGQMGIRRVCRMSQNWSMSSVEGSEVDRVM
jgi:hypothetical protein